MVCTANDLLGWKDFPKGLRVLLLDEDITSATEIRSKLEEMDYVVSTFYSTNEALSAISDNSKGFHVAIVEVGAANNDERFKFLERAKDLPTIMTSDVNCISTMMKCIALGAVEFLKKPLSEDKLRNIWQHVAHKAFNAGSKDRPRLLKSEKESVASIMQPELGNEEIKEEFMVESEIETRNQEPKEEDISAGSDKYPAPSTPQIEQGVRLVDNGDCQDHDQPILTMEKDCIEIDGESKFVETTCDDIPSQRLEEGMNNGEDEMATICKSVSNSSPRPSSSDCFDKLTIDSKKRDEASKHNHKHGTKSSRRKVKGKVDWTPELHKKFVQAVEQLGVDQAIPSRILELMNVEGLTRHNVASHLQKYRLQRRHILPKESERRWPQPRHSAPRNYYAQKPIMAYPPYHSNHALPGSQVYPAWVPPHSYPPQMWGPQFYRPWQSSESWQWNPYGVHADAWGCPMMPPHPYYHQNASQFHSRDPVQNSQTLSKNSFDNYPGEEVLDKVVKEAISKPWLPLPLGLKPPSTESVITELSKQGISTVPPRVNVTHPC